MAVQLVRLKSGEDVIADVNNMYKDETKASLIGYIFKRPCVAYMDVMVDAKGKKGYKAELISWMPLAKDDQIPVPLDWVVTMTTPVDKLMEMYQKDVVNFENDD